MKKIILILIGLFAIQLANAHEHRITAVFQQQSVYVCPMHPEVRSGKPGKCPKCGMALVLQKQAKKPVTPAKKPATAKLPASRKTPTTSRPDDKEKAPPMRNEHSDAPAEHQGHEMTAPKKQETHDMASMTGQMDTMNHTGVANLMKAIQIARKNLGPVKTIQATRKPHTVRYDLYVADTMVNYSGKLKRAIAVNGQIPMPTLTFTEGDTAEIYVHNRLKEETSLHWHGLFLPNRYDGVPNLTQMPIKPGATHVYRFPIVQHGTHWYHSHTELQEQIGMYGAFIMLKRAEWNIPTIPVILSEWTDMKPEEVDRSLHAATDWFAIKKGSTQSYSEAIGTGNFKTKIANEWKRMNAMDVSDVYYDRFLINGKNQDEHAEYKAGDKVRLRIANAGASSYFWLTYSGGKITVVATDGNDVEPVEVDRLMIAVSETYDVVVTIPENKSYEFLVTPEDRTKSASLWLGKGQKVAAEPLPRLKYFAGMEMMNNMMDMNGNMIQMEGMKMHNQLMDMNTVMYPEITGNASNQDTIKSEGMHGMHNDKPMSDSDLDAQMAGMNGGPENIVTLNYDHLRAPEKTVLPEGPWRELRFDLTGNMNRYVWTLDNKTVSETDKILIKKGENLRIILFNNSMMRHPMHLHGHDFRVRNGQGEYAPMKNVLDIMPMELDTIEFAANEPGGDWFFHCHILYHMMSGMGRIFSYENSPPNPDVPDPKMAQRMLFRDDRMFHLMGTVGLESNGSDGELMYANTRYRLSTEWRLGLKGSHGNEVETYFGRYLGRMQWWFPFIGFDYHQNDMMNMKENNLFGQATNQNNRKAFVAGLQYTLPMLFVAEARVDSKGKFRFQLMREDVPLTPRLRLNIMGNTDREYMGGLRYIVTKYFSLSTHYDSDMGYGAGISLTY